MICELSVSSTDSRWVSRWIRYSAVPGLVVMLLLAAVCGFAQTTNGRITGSIQDATGAVIPGASLTLVNNRTDAKAEMQTDAVGGFVFPALPPGVYTLTVGATGFRKAVVSNIEVTVGLDVPLEVKLEIGAATESVVVEANAVTVQTAEAQMQRATTMKDIDTLPQLARQPIALAVYAPGVQINAGDPSYSRVNGLRQGSNNSKLDGIDINDSVVPRLGLSMTANNTDSIGEFRIVTGAGKAEYGRSAGGQVELITRSGTNQFHGNGFEYLRNTDLNANDWFNNASGGSRPVFIQNIFGGSFGGPIKHDRLFIFGNYQGRRTAQQTIRNRTVYTPEAKAGNFRYLSGGNIQSFNIPGADPMHIGIDPTMAKIFAQTPNPNNFDVGDGLNTGGFRFNNPSGSMEDQFTIKGDAQVTSSNHAFLRWSWQRNSSIDALNSADATFPGMPQGTQGGHRWGYAIGDDWTISSSLVNEFRIGYQSATTDFLRPNRLQGPSVITNLITDLNYSGYPQGRNSPVIDLTENLTILRGKHTFKTGGAFRRTKQYGYNDSGIWPNITTAVANGNIVASTIGPQGLASSVRSTFEQMYNDVLGRVDNTYGTFYSDLQTWQAPSTPQVRNYILKESGLFFQDDWKINKRLTLNLGLRWEYFAMPVEQNGLQGYFPQANLINGVSQSTTISLQKGSQWFKGDKNNFAPRVGFAWDVFGDGKTAVRGSFGVFYDRMMGSVVSAIDGSTPGFVQVSNTYPNQSNNELRVSSAGLPMPSAPAAPVLTLPLTRGTSISLMDPNLRTGYVMNYTLGVQREVLRNTVLDVAYVGNRGLKLFLFRNVNQFLAGGDFLNAFNQMQAYANGGAAPGADNVFVKLYGSAATALSSLGSTNFKNGLVGTVASTIDSNSSNYSKYAAAGLPATYLRNYPQFNQVRLGTNDGRSYYDSLQVSVRRSMGALRLGLNYTFSHSLDDVGGYSSTSSAAEGNGFTTIVDNYNVRLQRGTSDFNHKQVFSGQTTYTLPIGKGKLLGGNIPHWVDTFVGGWDLGGIMIWQTGAPFTVLSQRYTTGNTANYTWANYSGATGIGSVSRAGNGVFFLSAADLANFSFPSAGQIGTSGRNTFYGPRFFNIDLSMVKKFRITEKLAITFRTEAYNLINNPNFGGLSTNLNSPATFGKFSSTIGAQSTNARVLQMSGRFDF